MVDRMCFASLYVPTSGNQGDLTAVEKRLILKFIGKLMDCTGHFMCLERVLATDSSDSTAAHTYLPSTVIKKSFEKAQKNSRDLNSEDVEEQKQTLLSTEDVEMWVTHLDSVKKQRQAGARKAAATRKQKSSDKVATAGNEFWCLCGGPESGNTIACDNPDCPIEWFHFEYVRLVDAPSGKWLCTE